MVGFLVAIRSWAHGNRLDGLLIGLASAGLLYWGFQTWRTYRVRLAATREKIGSLRAAQSRYTARKTVLQAQLGEWQRAAAQSTERARESLSLFETGTLSQPNRLLFPFASLFSRTQGDLVRVVASQVDWFRTQLGREIEESKALPGWLEETDGTARSGARLFKLERLESDRLVLSRAGAYEWI